MRWSKIQQYTYWQDGDVFVGFLNDYPDDSAQALSMVELERALAEIHRIRREEERHLAKIRKAERLKKPA